VEAIQLVVVLLAVVAVVTLAAERIGIPYPILMVVGGLALGLIPAFSRIELDPELVLLLFLPPILFSAAFLTSPRELWRSIRPITLLAFGLVLTTTLAVGAVLVALVPGVSWPAAIALGAIVSPPDAIAATSIARRLGLPRRLVTIIEGESLLNDATALTTYRLAVIAAVPAAGAAPLGAIDIAVSFITVAAGGLLIGIAVGLVVVWLLDRLDDPPVEVLITLIAPFAAYLPAEAVHVSGVLAAVSAGLVVGWRASRVMSSSTRILGMGTWKMATFVVNGMAFLLIGLQLPTVMDAVAGRSAMQLAGLATAIAATVIVVRLAWVFPATYLPRWLIPSVGRRDPAPPPTAPLVLGWAGMRGAVSLAAALALTADFPERDLLVFLTFTTILVTLVGQGLTLPWLIARVRLGDDGAAEHEEVHAREAATQAALRRLDELVDEIPGHQPLIAQLRDRYEHRSEHYSHAHGDETDVNEDPEQEEHERIRREAIAAERFAVLALRDDGAIGEEVLRRVERDLDLEELRSDV
jgi:Na+/H+ antiporter